MKGFADVRVEMAGKRFGRLSIEGYAFTKQKRAYWNCVCDCGNKLTVIGKSLRLGKTQSCGCLQVERARTANTRHGKKGTRIYGIWMAMKNRVNRKIDTHYKYYGGKGIKICRDWYDFNKFLKWALENGYTDTLTIDRKDNSKDYCPENCRWATWKEQRENKTNSVKYKGELASHASIRLGGNNKLVSNRIKRYGWQLERAFTEKVRKNQFV